MNTQTSELLSTEDWWANWLGFFLVFLVYVGLVTNVPQTGSWANFNELLANQPWLGLVGLMVGLGATCALGLAVMKKPVVKFLSAFPVIFGLTALSFIIGDYVPASEYGLSYALWALVIGLLISNTIRVPDWLKPGVKTEYYIKIGLVILGGRIIFSKLLEVSQYGFIVAWGVTPIVLITMFWLGWKIFDLSPSLSVTIASATSVCGVSAAIAAAGASQAKKKELTLAVGMTLIFTVAMMVVMPMVSQWIGLSEAVGGAWLGGTIDSTGAVAAAGAFLGENALDFAVMIKMIQNILIGFIAFFIAVYWVARFHIDEEEHPGMIVIWERFPKFVIGFVVMSLAVSFIAVPIFGNELVAEHYHPIHKAFRKWFFGLAFLCIGLDSNFKDLWDQMAGGNPLWLYLIGQTFNILLTLFFAWLAFSGVIFPEVSF